MMGIVYCYLDTSNLVVHKLVDDAIHQINLIQVDNNY